MAAVLAVLAVALVLVAALALWALWRLHDVEEAVALHELALGHLTQPGVVIDHARPGADSPVRLLRQHG